MSIFDYYSISTEELFEEDRKGNLGLHSCLKCGVELRNPDRHTVENGQILGAGVFCTSCRAMICPDCWSKINKSSKYMMHQICCDYPQLSWVEMIVGNRNHNHKENSSKQFIIFVLILMSFVFIVSKYKTHEYIPYAIYMFSLVIITLAFSLKANQASSVLCPVLISSACWAAIGYKFIPETAIPHTEEIYGAFLVTGILAGFQIPNNFNFFNRRMIGTFSVYWVLLPVILLEFTLLWGALIGFGESWIFSHMYGIDVGGFMLGMKTGFFSGLASWIIWRLCIKWVWR